MKRLLLISLYLLLTACSSITERGDSAPSPGSVPNIADIPNAVPRDEPKSRYGNPAYYDVMGKRYYTLASSKGYHERGIASWYGTKFHGKKTSSGEVYDMYAMTAAHKTLPLPTFVRVTNLENGRSVIVKVNDRGPFHSNRLIDLSYVAAKKLGIVAKGTGLVDVQAITPGTNTNSATQIVEASKPIPPKNVALYLQVGAFSTENRAERLKSKLQQEISDSVVIMPFVRPQGNLYRVRIGPLANVADGDELANRLSSLGFADAQIVVE